MKKQIREWIIRFMNKILGMQNSTLEAELSELLWSQRFVTTTLNSKWFRGGVVPGGWAVGYPFLCVLYRILDEIKPCSILELGLGQSTKLTAAYMCSEYNDGTLNHVVIEHDEEWIRFMENSIDVAQTEIRSFPLCQIVHKGYMVTAYKGFNRKNVYGKYDMILVDAPFGSEYYSRVDILGLIPDCLATDFVIMIDDYDRKGEQNMCKELLDILARNEIPFCTKVYSGQRKVMVIASVTRKFVCTMN